LLALLKLCLKSSVAIAAKKPATPLRTRFVMSVVATPPWSPARTREIAATVIRAAHTKPQIEMPKKARLTIPAIGLPAAGADVDVDVERVLIFATKSSSS